MAMYVLAGVLGSGKTTLMARLARSCIDAGYRVGLVVNDIADLGVDAMVLAETGWPHAAVDALNGACACCSDGTDLDEVLEGMRELRREIVLFETTGVADAADMLNQLTEPDLRRVIQTPRCISLVDATRYPDPLGSDPIVRRQIELADLIVLTKTDLVPAGRVEAATSAILLTNPDAPLAPRALTERELRAVLDTAVAHEEALDRLLADGPPRHPLPHTVSVSIPRALDRERFQALLGSLPPSILRAKGFVGLDDEPGLHIFQFVAPALVQIAPFQLIRRPGIVMASGQQDPYGVFIGTAVDEAWLRAAIDGCAAG